MAALPREEVTMIGVPAIKFAVSAAMILAIVLLGSASAILWSRVEAKNVRIASLSDTIAIQRADIARWQIASENSHAAMSRLQKQIDIADAKAREVQSQQMAAVAQRQLESRASQNRTSSILQALKSQANEKPNSPTAAIFEDFDPIVLAGIRRLQCLQNSNATGRDPAECAGRASLSTDRPFVIGAPTRARRYAPTVMQQIWLLSLVYRFRDWGEACYRDKDLIGLLGQ
jgi:hypothetical protein